LPYNKFPLQPSAAGFKGREKEGRKIGNEKGAAESEERGSGMKGKRKKIKRRDFFSTALPFY